MGIAATVVPANIPVESRADVPELVEDRHQFLIQIDIQETGQIEAQNVENLVSRCGIQSLEGVRPSADVVVNVPP